MGRYTPKFKPGDAVTVTSKVSKRRGQTGIIEKYCNGRYPNICRVIMPDGKIIQFFDTNLQKL